MPLRIPATVTGLQASIEAQAKKAGQNLKINLGTSAKSIEGLSQPLGRITGKADQFTKSMEAANARVLAFGASVGVLSAVTQGFKELVTVTIQVEKQLTAINTILGGSAAQLDKFKKVIFEVARNTEQSFDTVANAALELSRQGLSAEDVVKRLNDAMILARLSGQGATEAVSGLTAAINSFGKGTITSTEVVNKFSQAAKNAAVSERDLAEAVKRAGSVASLAGVSFDELVGVVSAVQQKTARGGAVIGNSFKTIFTRIQSLDKLRTMQNLGVQVEDTAGNILSATRLIQNLAGAIKDLPEARQLQIAENLVGKFQVAPFVAILDDYNEAASTAIRLTEISQKATTEAYERNAALNNTLSAAINEATVNLKELANTLGEIGITDSLRNILGFFNSLVGNIKEVLEGEGLGNDFARGIVKGIGNILSGPGLAIFGAIIAKLTIDLARFGVGSLQTFFGLNRAAKEQATLQGQIASTLLGNKGIQAQILSIENSTLSTEQKRVAQTKFFTTALNEQLRIMTQMQGIAARVAPGVARGTRGGRGRAAGGYIPNFNAVRGYGTEKSDIARGVGGAPASARPVSIPNFNFGGGQRGTMVANTSEFIVPNFAGGGSAIFNQDMVSSMGLPAGARRVSAAGGFIPNFVDDEGRSTVGKTKGLTLGQAVAGFRAGSLNRSALTSGFGKEAVDARLGAVSVAGRPVAAAGSSGILRIPGRRYGVAALFPSKKTTTTSTNFTGEQTNPGIIGLQQRGFTGISFSGVQISDLQTMQRGIKGGMKESENRRKIGRLFAEPLARYGGEIIPDAGFQNDELTDIQNKIKKLGRGKGAKLFSTAVEGGIFEAAVSLVTKGAEGIRQFKDHTTEREPFDFEEGGRADTKFKRAFRFTDDLVRADAKRTASNSAVQTLIFKALNDPTERAYILRTATAQQKKGAGKGRTGAGGYIPNFNVSPLQDAIARETGAGLPVNQVRINQSPKLRNAGNPMGLAVTNTRDEPTGAIPNFRKTGGERPTGDLITKFLILQTVVAGLGGVLGQTTDNAEGFNKALQLMNIAMTAFFAAQAFNLKGAQIGAFATGGLGRNIMKRGAAQRGAAANLTGATGQASRLRRNLAIGGAARGAGGALLSVVGPAVAIAAALKIGSEAFNIFSGNAKEAAERQKDVAKSAKEAASRLNELDIPQSFKDLQSESAQRGGEALVGSLGLDTVNFGPVDLPKALAFPNIFGVELGGGLFPGKDKDAEKTLSAAFENALKSGLLSNQQRALQIRDEFDVESDETVRRTGGFSAKVSEEFFESKLAELADLGKVDANAVARRIAKELTQSQLIQLGQLRDFEDRAAKLGVSDQDINTQIKAVGKSAGGAALIKDLNPNIKAQIQERFGTKFRPDVAEGFAEQLQVRSASDFTKEQERIARLSGEQAKIQLSTQLKLIQLRAKATSESEKQLKVVERVGLASKTDLADLKAKIALEKNTTDTNLNLLKVIQGQVSSISSLNVDVSKRNDLMDVFKDLTFDQLQDEEKRAKIVLAINSLDQEARGIGLNILATLEEQFKAEESIGKEKRNQIEDANELNKKEAERLDILERISSIRNRNVSLRADIASSRLNRGQERLRASREVIESNPNLTDRERRQSLFNLNPQEQAFERARFEVDSIRKLGETFNRLGSDVEGLVPLMGGLGRALSPENLKAQGGLQNILPKIIEEIDDQIKESFKGTEAENKLEELANTVRKVGLDFGDLNLKLLIQAAILQKNVNPAVQDLGAKLRQFVENLPAQRQELLFQSAFATPDQFVSQSRGFRENILRNRAGSGFDAQFNITRGLSLEAQQDRARTGITLADRRQAERQIPLITEQFRVQQELNKLKKESKPDLEKIRKLELEILDIERKRKMVNEEINNLFADTFIKSFEDIERQLGKTLVQDARQFKDTITGGIVDAIVLGQDLGDTLRQAATEFFSSRAKAQLEAAFDGILSTFSGEQGARPERGQRGGLLNVLGGAVRGLFGFNSGGLVTGGSRTMDDVPTLLTGGEFVIRRSAVEKYGPEFLEALNRGGIQTMQRGGLFTPGTFGQGSITGSRDLLDFATQNLTTGQQDRIGGGAGFGFASLEPQSARLTMFGRRNSPLFQQEQDSKREAFGLFTRQAQLEEQLAEQRSQQRRAFRNSLIAFVAATALGELTRPESVTPTSGTDVDVAGGGVRGLSERPPPGLVRRRGGATAGGGASTVLTPRTLIPELPLFGTAEGDTFFTDPDAYIDDRVNMNPAVQAILSLSDNPFASEITPTSGASITQFLRDNPNLPEERVREILRSAGNAGIRVPSIRKATGGYVSPSAGVDSVPAMLTGGEFVMNAGATQRIGRGNLAALNGGGGVGEGSDAVVARLDELIAVSGEGGDTVINITVNSDGTETTEGEGDTDQQTLALRIRDVVRQTIDEEKRLGGSLRRQ
jgi:TP901 family phage tail tape measure protein